MCFGLPVSSGWFGWSGGVGGGMTHRWQEMGVLERLLASGPHGYSTVTQDSEHHKMGLPAFHRLWMALKWSHSRSRWCSAPSQGEVKVKGSDILCHQPGFQEIPIRHCLQSVAGSMSTSRLQIWSLGPGICLEQVEPLFPEQTNCQPQLNPPWEDWSSLY